jgi:hypothetical protein
MMKGQLVFEFVLASLILFSVIIYAITYMTGSVGSYHGEFVSNSLESWVVKVSDVLLRSPERGIVSEWPMLDSNKYAQLESECQSDYDMVIERFGLVRKVTYDRPLHLYVSVEGVDGVTYMTCGNVPPQRINRATITRFALLPSNDVARVMVTVW